MSHTIVWVGKAYPEFTEVIQREIDGLLEGGLANACDLFFHSIWLYDVDPEVHGIFLSGKEGGDPDTYYAEYIGEPHWVTVESKC